MNAPVRTALLAAALALTACHARRHAAPTAGVVRDLPPRGPEKLLDSLMAHNRPGTRYYSAKADVELRTAEGNKSFKAHVRCVKDSAAWLSVVPALGIEVARALLTPDSLKMMDKIHDTFWVGDTAAAQRKFGLQPSLALFEQALLGLPIGLDPNEKYRSDREDGQYTLTSKEKRRFVRAAEDLSPGDTLPDDKDMKERRLERTLRRAERKEAMVIKYWIEPDSFQVTRVLIADLARDQQADVRYMQRTPVDGRLLPTLVTLSLSDPVRQVSGTLGLDRISLDGPLQLNFRIPEKFTPMP
ncbi:MAG: DUF4292 domain-containing protein [Bacteroidetes bacterium]|nr:DUF4292 domain-containing protein [Bacteroidota bacterium]